MAYSLQLRNQAFKLRKSGYSVKEVAKILKISVSTSSLWLRNIIVSQNGIDRMNMKSTLNKYKTSLRWKEKRSQKLLSHKLKANKIINEILLSKSIKKLICAVLFWAEGSKNTNHVAFTNSDPKMIALFLNFFRDAYDLDESKFRVSAHLHNYHNIENILNYWQQITNISLNQFIKPYIKPHTGLRKKQNYKGCIAVRYYDSEIASELTALYNSLSSK